MKFLIPLLLLTLPAFGADFSIDDYNSELPVWGTSWRGDYRPSFYTGFAIRQETPERIHIRVARGNQTRVSVILDEQSLIDYPFDLAKRYEFYQKAQRSFLQLATGKNYLPQLESFNKVIESNAYGILPFTEQAAGASAESLYAKGLELAQALNPGRIFLIHLDLTKEFAKWQAEAKENPSWATPGYFAKNPKDAIVAIDTLVLGRVNYTEKPSAEVLSQLTSLAGLAQAGDASFTLAAAGLFRDLTGKKYNIRVLENGKFAKALRCESADNCFLTYPEFTAVYPTGSAESFTRDQFGNSIPNFATQGLWQFYNSGMSSVDNIRDEGYYGWIPKMNYQQGGNGFHNPAVRFPGVTNKIREALHVSASHNIMWLVKRGGVSHGCLRLPAGHAWEMRHILPVENDKVLQVKTFHSASRDFDVYDIDGDGNPELMGVNYLVLYDAKGGREVKEIALSVNSAEGKYEFYKGLYGARGVFNREGEESYSFNSPSVSLPSYLDFRKQHVSARVTMKGSIPFYEAPYEQDKIQFYGTGSMNQYEIRLMGRVRGCAPASNKQTCGEAAFDREAASYVR
jgi:hypothetical protein